MLWNKNAISFYAQQNHRKQLKAVRYRAGWFTKQHCYPLYVTFNIAVATTYLRNYTNYHLFLNGEQIHCDNVIDMRERLVYMQQQYPIQLLTLFPYKWKHDSPTRERARQSPLTHLYQTTTVQKIQETVRSGG